MLCPSHELLLAATPRNQFWWPVAADSGDLTLESWETKDSVRLQQPRMSL